MHFVLKVIHESFRRAICGNTNRDLNISVGHQREHTLLILLYRAPGIIYSFVTDLIELIDKFQSTVNATTVLLLGNFNLDQMLQEIVNKMHPLTQRFHLRQHSQYSTRAKWYSRSCF